MRYHEEERAYASFMRKDEHMGDWVIYVVVGLVVGTNLGYMIGIRRGAMIVGELISGIMGGIVEGIDGKGREVLASDKE